MFQYDVWHELGIVLNGSDWDYYLDGSLLGSVDANGSVGLGNVILQGYNQFTGQFGDYEIQWQNLQAGPDSQMQVPEPDTMLLMGLALGGLFLARRRQFGKQGALKM